MRDYGVSGQIGLEQTPAEYVAQLVAVFAECWRVLRDDGCLWLNLGDSYASSTKGSGGGWAADPENYISKSAAYGSRRFNHDVKDKDLLGIPWRVAFALQDAGWYIRSDVIWAKPNPMPESVTDRPTKAHEYVFLLTKQARYFYDDIAIREENTAGTIERARYKIHGVGKGDKAQAVRGDAGEKNWEISNGRNARTVWTIATTPYSGAHFATMPPELARRCILAGTSERGQCPHCGKAWERVTEKGPEKEGIERGKHPSAHRANLRDAQRSANGGLGTRDSFTLGFRPICACPPHAPIPQIVMDPFSGAGTTMKVAIENGRRFVGTELNFDYIKLAADRTAILPVRMI